MTYISYCIWKECLFYRFHSDIFDKIGNLKSDIELTYKDFKQLERKVKRFEKRLRKRYIKVKKIEFMIQFFSQSLNVPDHRVSDSLFQFSPEIYLYESQIVVERLKEIIILSKKQIKSKNKKIENVNSDYIEKRIENLSIKIRNFYEAINRRASIQILIVRHKSLHHIYVDISEDFGFSSSFGAYCHGIQKVLDSCFKFSILKRIIFKIIKKPLIPSNRSIKNAEELLNLLYKKRRMYPGFDLHAILINLVRVTLGNNEAKEVLKGINQETIESFLNTYKKNKMTLIQKYEEQKKKERTEMNEKFQAVVTSKIQSLNNNNHKVENLVFITKGHSSSVKSALYSFAESLKKSTTFNNINIYIFILYNKSELKNKRINSRYLRYKFKESPNMMQLSNKKIIVKIGDLDWWFKNFNTSNTLNLSLSGVEFLVTENSEFKNEESICQVCSYLNDEGLENLDTYFSSPEIISKPISLIFAESYKIIPERYLKKTEFYRLAYNRSFTEDQTLYKSKKRIIISS